jgi:hypothetical protein
MPAGMQSKDMLSYAMSELRDKINQGEVSANDLAQAAAMFRMLFGANAPVVDVLNRLQQVQEAYNAGMITDNEYHQKRTELANQLG